MKKTVAQNKYKEGEVVSAKVDPGKRLIIIRYLDRIYYCRPEQSTSSKNLVYFERELELCQ